MEFITGGYIAKKCLMMNHDNCTLEEFAVYFLSFIKSQTEEFTKVNSSKCNTPQKFTGILADDKALHCSNNNSNNKNNSLNVYRRNLSRDLFPEETDLIKKNSVDGEIDDSFSEIVDDHSRKNVTSSNMVPNTTSNSQKSFFHLERRFSNNNSDNLIHSSPIHNRNYSSLMSMTSTPINNKSKNSSRNSSSFEQKSMSNKKTNDKSSNSSKKSCSNSSFTLSDFVLNTSSSHKTKRKSASNSNTGMPAVANIQLESLPNNKSKTSLLDSNFPELSPSPTVVNISKKDKTLANSQNMPAAKTIKRVVPITLSKTVSNHNDFISSSFKSENNLLEFNCEEEKSIAFGNHHKIELDRKFRMNKNDDIIKCFEDEQLDNNSVRGLYATLKENIPPSNRAKTELKININKITNRKILNAFTEIYSTIIDMNLTTNILTEISYLINLLNLEVFDATTSADFRCNSISETEAVVAADALHVNDCNGFGDEMPIILRNINNCIYFALETLNKQKYLLALLDTTTLKVLIDNERLMTLNVNLQNYLKSILSHKLSLDSVTNDASFSLGSALFQQENDSKSNFPTDREFAAFKKQRDMFYTILRTWEIKHLNPMWNFSCELGAKVKSLITVLDNPINMAHLSKLFIAQLLISCNFDNSTSDLQMALPNIDLNKLSKLRQRLIAPSSFSMQYLFSGNQIFFRDFIVAAFTSNSFIEQLRMALVNELTDMNNSSFELINLADEENSEYVVRPESISTMRIIAKFIGFVMAQSFQYENYRNTLVDNRQINLRNKVTLGFDVKVILIRAITERKLVITIPWLVQYISMLDYITLRLHYFKDIFTVLYELYILSSNQTCELIGLMTPTTTFIVRTSLGWLFEHPNVPDEYYNYRENRLEICMNSELCNESGLTMNSTEYRILKIFVRKTSNENLKDYSLVMQKFDDSCTTLKCILEPIASNIHREQLAYRKMNENKLTEMNKSLEGILIASCPFLADFRVSVMPTKITKSLSRTGRYRHITTKYSSDASFLKQKSTSNQNQLLEAFLQSQSLSVRRTVEFVIERTTSAAIKDFQIEVFYPLKKISNEKLKLIKSTQQNTIVNEIHNIYSSALQSLYKEWDEKIPKMLSKRITMAIESLLPAETLDIVKKTCINIGYQKSLNKSNDWRCTNMPNIDIFTKDIYGEAYKILKSTNNNQIVQQQLSNQIDLRIEHGIIAPSDVFIQLQSLLHCAAELPHTIVLDYVILCMRNVIQCLKYQSLADNMYRITAYMILELSLLLISNQCDLVTPEYLCLIVEIWKLEQVLQYTTPKSNDAEDDEENDCGRPLEAIDEVTNLKSNIAVNNFIFANVINCRYFRTIKNKSHSEILCLSNFLIVLIENDFITLDLLNNQFVTLFTEDWNEMENRNISFLFDNVLRKSSKKNMDKQEFFLDVLSELAKEIDEF